MQDLTLSIPFNREMFITANKIRWALPYKKTLKSYIFYTVLSACILIGGLFDNLAYPIMSVMGGSFLFFMILSWSGLLERRSKFYKLIYQQANEYDHQQMDCTYTFSDSRIEYRDKEKSYSLSWHLIKPFTIYKNHMLVSVKSTSQVMFIISKQEISDDDYKQIQHFFAEKCAPAKGKTTAGSKA